MKVQRPGCNDKPGMTVFKVFFTACMIAVVIISALISVDTIPLANELPTVKKFANTTNTHVKFVNTQFQDLPRLQFKGRVTGINYTGLFPNLRVLEEDPSSSIGNERTFAAYFYNSQQFDTFLENTIQTNNYVKFCNESVDEPCICWPNDVFTGTIPNKAVNLCFLKDEYLGRKFELKAKSYVVGIGIAVDFIAIALAFVIIKCCHSQHEATFIKKQKNMSMNKKATEMVV